MDTEDVQLNFFGRKAIPVLVEVDLLNAIQKLSVCTDEIYESQSHESFVHNILNSERIRLKKINASLNKT